MKVNLPPEPSGLPRPLAELYRLLRKLLTSSSIREEITLEVTLTSGAETTMENPLPSKSRPKLWIPGQAVDTNGVAREIRAYRLDATRSDGQIGLTITLDAGVAALVTGLLSAG